MREIELTQGKVALVDDEDFEKLNQYNWYASKQKNTYYAMNDSVKQMHRFIMNTPVDLIVDHKDHDGLNNQKYNLRNCTITQNSANRVSVTGTSSKYKGVSWHKNKNKWIAQIRVNKKLVHLGVYRYELSAARVYNNAAVLYFGEFASLNKVD